MYDCLSSINFRPQFSLKVYQFGSTTTCLKFPKFAYCSSIAGSKRIAVSINSTGDRDAIPFTSDKNEHEDLEFGLLERETDREFVVKRDKDESEMEEAAAKSGLDGGAEDLSFGGIFNFRRQKKDDKLVKGDRGASPQGLDSELDELEGDRYRGTVEVAKSRKKMTRRSNVMAKQVISIRTALSLGFISQLWVDTSTVSPLPLFCFARSVMHLHLAQNHTCCLIHMSITQGSIESG